MHLPAREVPGFAPYWNDTATPLIYGEFDTVGSVVKQFASDDATVVVGTVIDPEMSGRMRVTVVATGLGRHGAMRQQPEVRVVRRNPVEKPDWDSLDQPAVRRKRAVGDDFSHAHGGQEELLDIPAFLRRQAD